MQTEAVWRALPRKIREVLAEKDLHDSPAQRTALAFKKRESTVFSGEGGGVSACGG